MRKLTAIALLITLFACARAHDFGANVREGVSLGNYQITGVEVVPFDDSVADDNDYLRIKPMLEQALVREFTNTGVGRPPAYLTVRLLDLSTEINAMRAIMVGDSYRMNGRAIVWQNNRENQLLDVQVHASSGLHNSGLIGAFNAATNDDATTAENTQTLVNDFAREIKGAIYPEHDN